VSLIREQTAAVREICLQSADESLKPLGGLGLIPRFVTDGMKVARPEQR